MPIKEKREQLAAKRRETPVLAVAVNLKQFLNLVGYSGNMSRNTMYSLTAQFNITAGTMLICEQIVKHVLTKTDQFMVPVNH